ncbi:UDP-N-acetylglucosamine 1-carboxyvinyltransferase [Patescibacteria group bacterium]|nr:UDP-N-acetylglucosamine 1-carboxyvinyltransferase [Patescibacteria group bacterium]
MSKLIIQGGRKLRGEIRISGMKNAATPILAACILAKEKCVIKNIPDISDVNTMLQILKSLGFSVLYKNHTATILPRKIELKGLDVSLIQKLRSSILILGPLLARMGKISLPEPGGCIIGRRPIDTHLYGFQKLGAKVLHKNKQIFLSAQKLSGAEIILPEFSVTATENILMAACIAEGTTIIKLAAIEPHVIDLIKFLNTMGANIKQELGHTIVVKGVKKIFGGEHTVIPDSIEAGTFAIAALITKGRLKLLGIEHSHLDAVYELLERIGAGLILGKNSAEIFFKKPLSSFKLQALPYPGFPTDLQAPFGLLATGCKGTSLIHDPLYEGRMGYVNELIKMGANATICDPHRVLITGPTALKGMEIKGLDLRAGATLVLAGLIAQGRTVVDGAENLDRGYERFDERLCALGADIKRE